MTEPCIDTSIIIRLITGDDPAKQAAAAALFKQIEDGQLTAFAPVTVIADAVYVLNLPVLYNLPRAQVVALLVPLVRIPHFGVENRSVVLRAPEVYASNRRLDFGDAMIVAAMEDQASTDLYSYDRDFDRTPGVRRLEP